MARLVGKYAVVTGGSSGIGAAIAEALAAQGAAVLAVGRRFTQATVPVLEFGSVATMQLDVCNEAGVHEVMAALPELDILVCAAGTGTFTPMVHETGAAVREMLDTHVVGTFFCAREAFRRMQQKRAGHIVAISSVAVHKAFADCAGYTAAKAGQLGLIKVLAEEARPYNVRVTAVLPGATNTPIWDDRPGFDRSKMLAPKDVASVVVSIVARPAVAVEEITVMPPGGAL